MRVGNVRRDGSILPALVTKEHAYPLRVIPQSLEPELGPALAVLLTLTSGLDTVYEVAQAAISRGGIAPEPQGRHSAIPHHRSPYETHRQRRPPTLPR